MFDAKTPEAAAYLAQREATEQSRKQIWHRVALVLMAALAISTGTNVYNAYTTGEIRDTQVSNSKITDCEEGLFNVVVKEFNLAFAKHDRNKADFQTRVKTC